MNKISIYRLMAFLVVIAAIIASCAKEVANVRLDPQLTTSQVLSVKSDSATVVGFVIASGSGFTERGVCYDTVAAPTTSKSKVVFSGVSQSATFNVVLPGLKYATKYYARAYGINASGTLYGEELNFTTLPIVPKVITADFTAPTGTTAKGGGRVYDDGKSAVTQRGICISLEHNPTIDDTVKAHQLQVTKDGVDTGSFVSTVSTLKGLTTYYVRAYAKNSAGVGYGQEVTFTTPAAIVTLWIAGDFQGWNPAGAKDSLMNTDSDPIVRGYAYISTTGGFKFVSKKSWDGPNYGAGGATGKLSSDGGAGNLSVSEAGYYFFEIDLTNMTYTATKTTWGLIGVGGDWNNDIAMTYSTFFRKWIVTTALPSGSFKFRANGAWTLNYGDKPPVDGKLEAGGDNIAVANAGTYSVLMDLSSPQNYTYNVTQWSITGDAAGGWGVDTDMTPNSNNTWTVTTTLSVGDFKFRANHDWGLNLGGTPSALSWGGANIHISAAGSYTITLDLLNGTYTVN